MNQQEFQLREITYQDIKDLLAIEREVYAGELPWTMSAFMAELGSKAPHLYLLRQLTGKQLALLAVGFKERMHTLRMSLFTQHTKA